MLVCGSLNWDVTGTLTIITLSGLTLGKSNAAQSRLFRRLMVLYAKVQYYFRTFEKCTKSLSNQKYCVALFILFGLQQIIYNARRLPLVNMNQT